jgi:hypothetical protein
VGFVVNKVASLKVVISPASYSIGTGRCEADHSLATRVKVKKTLDLYIHFLIRLHGAVLNWLSIGTTLPSLNGALWLSLE